MARALRRSSALLSATLLLAVPALTSASTADAVERGRYLVHVSGCNDCHTAGWLFKDGAVPVEAWLTGDTFGWSGPWGTTYAANLRLFIDGLSEAQWIETAQTLRRRPPMPWFNLNRMNEEDLKAIYAFVKALGPAGEPAPTALPPGVEPPPPFARFP